MKVYFATNRNRLDESTEGDWFGDGFQTSTSYFRVGGAHIGLGKRGDDGTVSSVSVSAEATGQDPDTGRITFTQVGSTDLFKQLIAELKGQNKACLVFIPGFNYTFSESLTRAAMLADLFSDDSQQLVPFCFSWPSNGRVTPWDYNADRNDAIASGFAMARAFRALVRLVARLQDDARCNAPVHLLCHSMGNLALRHALQSIPRTGSRYVRLFDSAVLAAPDEDRDALGLETKLKPLGHLTKRLDIYYNPSDKPTLFSDDISDGTDRLGSYGPKDMSTLADFDCPITILNCRGINKPLEDLTRHQYYRISDVVIEDIQDVIRNEDRHKSRHRQGRLDVDSGHIILES